MLHSRLFITSPDEYARAHNREALIRRANISLASPNKLLSKANLPCIICMAILKPRQFLYEHILLVIMRQTAVVSEIVAEINFSLPPASIYYSSNCRKASTEGKPKRACTAHSAIVS